MNQGIPTIALVGVGGFGRIHLTNIHRLVELGRVRLTALVSGGGIEQLRGVVTPPVFALAQETSVYPTLEAYLRSGDPATIIVISTPIHTHTDLTVTALRAGAHVLLEKPPTPGMADFEKLSAVVAETGRVVQVGFQSFGSHALARMDELIASGAIGDLRGIGGVGTWSRELSYWTRSKWAGKRVLDGNPVVDGVVTNPLAHAVATALKLAGATAVADVAEITLDQYRANAIDCDDTSVVKVLTRSGVPVTLGLTLTSPVQSDPRVIAYGSLGTATLFYTEDVIELAAGGDVGTERFGRTNLTENLLDHLADSSVPLLCPLADTGAFTRVLDAVHTAPDPRRIPEEYVSFVERDGDTWTVVEGVDSWCERAAAEAAAFAALGAPWAR